MASNHICMDYQAFTVKYKGGFPYVGAILNMFPAEHGDVRGRLFAFDPVSKGWFRAVDESSGNILYKFHAPSGIIGNPITYMHDGKQYVAVLTGVAGWAAIGLAEGLTKGTEGLDAVGLTHTLSNYTNLGGTLVVFSLE